MRHIKIALAILRQALSIYRANIVLADPILTAPNSKTIFNYTKSAPLRKYLLYH